MILHPEFSKEELDQAYTYFGPGMKEQQKKPGGPIIFDFDTLGMLAESSLQRGRFKTSKRGDSLIAPVKLGKIPASFIAIESISEEDYDVHEPFTAEIIVVVDGKIRLSRREFPTKKEENMYKGPVVLREGETIIIRPRKTDVRAIPKGADTDFEKSTGLALAIPIANSRGIHLDPPPIIEPENNV